MLVAATALAVLVLWPVSAADAPPLPKTMYVNVNTGSDSNDGTSTALPLKTIKQALAVSSPFDTISVAPGIYSAASGEAPFPLTVNDGRALVSQGGPAVTTIQGEGAPHDVVFFSNSLWGAQLRGFTITGGGGPLGAVYAYRSSGTDPTSWSWPHVVGNRIVGNHGMIGSVGGGVLMFGSPDTPCNGIVEGNVVEGNSATRGGGVGISSFSSAIVRNNVIRNNVSDEGGGGVFLGSDSSALILANTITGNEALDAGQGGGGIAIAGSGAPVIEDNIITGNRSENPGGGLSVLSTPLLRMARNEIRSNSSSETAGGLYTFTASVLSQSDLIVGNKANADFGPLGAIRSAAGTVTLVDDTIADNEATGSPGAWNGMYFDTGANATVLGCSISHAGEGPSTDAAEDIYDLWGAGSPWDFRYTTLRQTYLNPSYLGTGTVTTESVYANRAGGDYRPAVGAQLVDTSQVVTLSPDLDSMRILTDIRGYPRPGNGSVDTTGVDRGAYELSPIADLVRGRPAYSDYALAAEVASRTFPGAVRTRDVVLASGDSAALPDVLSAAGLCWAYDAPLLLTGRTFLPTETSATLARLRDMDRLMPVVVHVIGGTTSVSDARLNQIRLLMGSDKVVIDRLRTSGNRYDMARTIAIRMHQVRGSEMQHSALIANGADTPKVFDALALSAVSRHVGAPILLVSATNVPSATSKAISELGLTSRFVAGGALTVSERVRTSLNAVRWSGPDRYSTATAIASKAAAKGWCSYGTICVAARPLEALLAALMAGHDGGVLVLSRLALERPASLPPVTGAAISAHKAGNAESYVFPSASSLQAAVEKKLR